MTFLAFAPPRASRPPAWRRAFFAGSLGLLLGAGPLGGAEVAAVSFAGGTYRQDFDGLPVHTKTVGIYNAKGDGPFSLSDTTWSDRSLRTKGMEGWQIFDTLAEGSPAGLNAHHGEGSASAAMSFGAPRSRERALGSVAGSARVMAFGVVLRNTSGRVIDTVTIAYRAEQWRLGRSGAGADTLTFSYQVGAGSDIASGLFVSVPLLNAVTPVTRGTVGALDGNAHAVPVAAALSGLGWKPGEHLILRWSDVNDPAGADHGLAIDDFSLTAAP